MKRYKIISNYGTFEVSRIVTARDEHDAWLETGIKVDLQNAGWDVTTPEGEEHTIIELPQQGAIPTP